MQKKTSDWHTHWTSWQRAHGGSASEAMKNSKATYVRREPLTKKVGGARQYEMREDEMGYHGMNHRDAQMGHHMKGPHAKRPVMKQTYGSGRGKYGDASEMCSDSY